MCGFPELFICAWFVNQLMLSIFGTCQSLYREEFRKAYQEENPRVTGMRQIGIACGAKWKEMIYEEKPPYYDIVTQKRAEYDKIRKSLASW